MRNHHLASVLAMFAIGSIPRAASAQLIDTAPQPDTAPVVGCDRGISVHLRTATTVFVTRLEAELNPTGPTNVRFVVWDVPSGKIVMETAPVAVGLGRQFVSSGDVTLTLLQDGDYQIAAMVQGCASWSVDTLKTENQNGIETRADGGIQTTYTTPNEPPQGGLPVDARIRIHGFIFNDLDGDTVLNPDDNCPFARNSEQTDSDGDGLGDACDPRDDRDLDADGVANGDDNCPFDPNTDQADANGDGHGDVCDTGGPDADDDGVGNGEDNCPFAANPDQDDTDGNGIGDACDLTIIVDGSGCNTGGDRGLLLVLLVALACAGRTRTRRS